MSRDAAIRRAERYFDDGNFRDDLANLIAFRTESQVPESWPELGRYLEFEIAPTAGTALPFPPYGYLLHP